jgi:hypothetical protein
VRPESKTTGGSLRAKEAKNQAPEQESNNLYDSRERNARGLLPPSLVRALFSSLGAAAGGARRNLQSYTERSVGGHSVSMAFILFYYRCFCAFQQQWDWSWAFPLPFANYPTGMEGGKRAPRFPRPTKSFAPTGKATAEGKKRLRCEL